MRYTLKQAHEAAIAAYRASMSGDNDNYVLSKAELFVDRCRRYDGEPTEETISFEAVEEVAFAALDPYCTAQL